MDEGVGASRGLPLIASSAKQRVKGLGTGSGGTFLPKGSSPAIYHVFFI